MSRAHFRPAAILTLLTLGLGGCGAPTAADTDSSDADLDRTALLAQLAPPFDCARFGELCEIVGAGAAEQMVLDSLDLAEQGAGLDEIEEQLISALDEMYEAPVHELAEVPEETEDTGGAAEGTAGSADGDRCVTTSQNWAGTLHNVKTCVWFVNLGAIVLHYGDVTYYVGGTKTTDDLYISLTSSRFGTWSSSSSTKTKTMSKTDKSAQVSISMSGFGTHLATAYGSADGISSSNTRTWSF